MTMPEGAGGRDRPGLDGRILFWGGAGLALFGLVWLLRDALVPFVAAFVLAYLLNPLATRLERLGLSRTLSALLILGLFLCAVIVLLVVLVPVLAAQLSAFVLALPDLVQRLGALTGEALSRLDADPLGRDVLERLGAAGQGIGGLASQALAWSGRVLGTLIVQGQAVLALIGLVVLAPIIALYLLVDWPRMLAAIDHWLPRGERETIRRLAAEIDAVLGAFVRGQAFVGLALGLFYGLALTGLGLNFGLLIGVLAGILSFIPYIGTGTGLVIALLIGLVQFGLAWWPLSAIAAVFAAGQILDGYWLQPRLVGARVGLHPVWLMFALVAFATLFGVVGLLLAVPMAAALGVLTRFAIERYLDSPLYRDEARASPSLPSDAGGAS